MKLPFSGERFMPGWAGPAIHLEHLHRYSLATAVVSGSVLDLGCGVGYGSQLLARTARRVVGTDGSLPAVGFASSEFAAPNLDYLVADARTLPFPAASFDWVVCFELIEHLQEAEAVVAEIARVLSADGRLLLSTPNRPVYSEGRAYSNPFHVRELDGDELQALLATAFGDIVLFGQRLTAGSVIWNLSRQHRRRQVKVFQPDPNLAPELQQGEDPTYLLALCAHRRAGRRQPLSESLMAGRLEAFLAEQAAQRGEAETGVHKEYQNVIDRLVAQLGEFDVRIRELGREIEIRNAARQEDVARLSAELAAERSRTASLEALRGNLEATIADLQGQRTLMDGRIDEDERRHQDELAALVAQMEAERSQGAARQAESAPQIEELRQALEQVRRDLDWTLGQWQAREAELDTIRRSKMWRLWMAYQATRRTVLSPFDFSRRLARSAGRRGRNLLGRSLRVPARVVGGLYLTTWTMGSWLSAVGRGRLQSRAEARRQPDAPATAPSLRWRPRILMVCPYPLYPADHGGGVRIFNLVRRLSRDCDIHLLVFIQGEDDPVQRQALEPWVEKLYFHPWQPRFLPDLWGLKPANVQLFEAAGVRALINEILAQERIDVLQLEYTELGQYGLPRFARVKVVLSEIDITFRSRFRRRRVGMHRRYDLDRLFGHTWTDWMRQFRYELQVTRRADQVHVMSPTDGAYLARFLPGGLRTVRVVPNAVDIDDYRPPPGPSERRRHLLFVGNFEHLPNLDAIDYLLGEVWPQVRFRFADAALLVVGARAGKSVHRYHGQAGVSVVGTVPETRPYYQQCRALVAPIRAGSGTRLKILEAMACATPVVTTTVGAEGIGGVPGEHFLTADTAADLARAICRLLDDDALCARLGREGHRLVEQRYSWEQSTAAALAGYAELLADMEPGEDTWEPLVHAADQVDVSVIIPTLAGGAVLERCLAAVSRQETDQSVEILCVDSGSSAADLAVMERYGARVLRIDRSQFNHGLTRDLGAAASRGRLLVFLNQDAVPCDRAWLDNLTAPLFAASGWVAVQGAILEIPDRDQRFYWDSCGERFYFTRESKRWIARYFGIGFSTVNAAIRRDAWERHPFGEAPIMEDKKWQREVVAAGHGIAVAPLAAVHHTHNYDFRSLSRRCESEGFGWRTLGEIYSWYDMLADMLRPRIYADLARGLARGRIRTGAELFFPVLRPWLVFRGNRWGQRQRA